MDNEYIIILCPHCNDNILVFIKDVNCTIFRHGIYKNNLTQIDPHASKELCDDLIKNDLIYGCGKPFRLIKNNNESYSTVICEYI